MAFRKVCRRGHNGTESPYSELCLAHHLFEDMYDQERIVDY